MADTTQDIAPDTDRSDVAGERMPALHSALAVTVLLAVTAIGLTADLLTKHYAFDSLLDQPGLARKARLVQRQVPQDLQPHEILQFMHINRPLMPGLDLTLSTNDGVVFGLPMKRWIVASVTGVTILMVLTFFATSPRRAYPLHVAMACILGGALGNLYDRLFAAVDVPGVSDPIRYQVRDFIDASQLNYNYIFNVADVLLVLGVGIVVLHWLLTACRSGK